MILRCTKKLLAVIGAGPADTLAREPDGEDWYANLLWIDRRKCLLLTHVATLFSILAPDVKVSELRSTHGFVVELIEHGLLAEQLPTDAFGNLRSQDLVLAKTADRSVLGCMNDMAFLGEETVRRSGGLSHTDITALNRALRRNINSSRGYERPIDLTVKRIGPPA